MHPTMYKLKVPHWVSNLASGFASQKMDGSNFGSDIEIQFWIRFLGVLWCGQHRQELSGSKRGSEVGSLGFGLICRLPAACAHHGHSWPTTGLISIHLPWTYNWGSTHTHALNQKPLNPRDQNTGHIWHPPISNHVFQNHASRTDQNTNIGTKIDG